MEKVFKIADIRKLEQQVTTGEISYSRMVELMNEMAYTHYLKNAIRSSPTAVEIWNKAKELNGVDFTTWYRNNINGSLPEFMAEFLKDTNKRGTINRGSYVDIAEDFIKRWRKL